MEVPLETKKKKNGVTEDVKDLHPRTGHLNTGEDPGLCMGDMQIPRRQAIFWVI